MEKNNETMQPNLSALSMDFTEFPESGSLGAYRTYVISTDRKVTTSTMVIPEGVTLCFMGGRLYRDSSSVTLTGNRTKIIAPIGQIFDSTLDVGGTWDIERAYPQWFGAQTGTDINNLATNDTSTAINNAILMKRTGEVFLPRGLYKVNKTIEVKAGIVLVGEPGKNDDGVIYGTTLVPCASLGNYTDGYLMCINMSGDTWEVGYISPGTAVRNIIFSNTNNDLSKRIPDIKGICTAGNFEVDTCEWNGFAQAIYNVFVYSDLRKIVNCTFNDPGDFHSYGKDTNGDKIIDKPLLYAFDLDTIGDALLFEHNGIHNLLNHAKALHIKMCGGGSINANIINNDVLIESSKGITFSSNHMEEGAQLVINNSNVTSLNNFFKKGSNANLVVNANSGIEASVVKSSGDMFLFYEKAYVAKYDFNNEEGVTPEIPPSTDPDYPVYQDYIASKTYLEGISEYDVQINNNCSVEFTQTYRYWVVAGEIGKVYTCGITVCNESKAPITDFNEQSYLLSSGSRIMPGYNVVKSAYVDNLLQPSSSGNGKNGYCKWHLNSGNYYYKYQIIWDRERKIFGQSGTYSWNGAAFINKTNDKYGTLFLLDGAAGCGNQAMLRVYRGTSTSYTQYVDIPVAGTSYFYDNGVSVCGFKWKTLPSTEYITSANTNITSIRYTGKNVECKAPAAPTQGTWTDGDIVYNTNPLSTISYWIHLGGAWRTKQ